MPHRARSEELPPATPANDCAAPESGVIPALAAHDLARLLAELAPLAAIDAAGGLRSVYRDPRLHPSIHGTAPVEETALDRAVDADTIARARRAWRWLGGTQPHARHTLLWLAVRAGAAVDVAAWAYEYGRTEGPAAGRERDRDLSARRERAEARLKGLRHRARDGIDEELAEAIDAAQAEASSLRPAAEASAAALTAWGVEAFRVAYAQWFPRGR